MFGKKISPRKSLAAWCLYDAGSSVFNTVIITFVFSVYFARAVVGDEVRGSALWSYALSAAGVIIALTSPVLGALADHYGARKPLLFVSSMVCIAATALLYFVAPAPAFVPLALGLLVIASVGSEISLVFSNAMLPHLAPAAKIGRLSGWAWACGYAGGLLSLILALVLLVGIGGHKPLLPLPAEHQQNIRATALLAAAWFFALMIPLLLWTHDTARTGLTLRAAANQGLRQLRDTFAHIRAYRNLVQLLIASAIYRDGLNTLFAVGGLYAAGTFGLNFTEILIFAIGLNVTAGLGAWLLAFADDRFGSKPVIMLSLCGLLATGVVLLCIHDKILFIGLALALGIFIGPAQAASRTLVARLSPPELVAQAFGLYAFTGKATAFLGPFLFGLTTTIFDSQRAGMATIVLFWLVGLIMLAFVREEQP